MTEEDSNIGELVEYAAAQGLFQDIGGVLHKCYKGDLSDPQPHDPFPLSKRVRIVHQQETMDTTDVRVLYTIQTGEWPYGLSVRRHPEKGLVATLSSNTWTTEEMLEEMLVDYRAGMRVREIAELHGMTRASVRTLAEQWLSPSARKLAHAARRTPRRGPGCACGRGARSGVCWRCKRKRLWGTCACGNKTNAGRVVCCDCRPRPVVLDREK